MTAPIAGWYADPEGGPGLRYWNGSGWAESTQQTPYQQAVYPQAAAQQAPYQQNAFRQAPPSGTGSYPGPLPAGPDPSYGYQPPAPTAPAANLWVQNKTSFITVAICVVYLAIAGFSQLVFFGILPALYTVRSFQAKEPLAILAAAVTVVTIGFSIWRTTH